MSDEFDRDLQRCSDELDASRGELLAVATALSDDDLDRGRRGGWTVRRVLEHLIWSEWLYSRLITHLRGGATEGELPESTPSSAADALERLSAAREALRASIRDVDEETFYRLGRIGHEEYSVLSVLENEINHDREHAAQVREIVNG